jgi:ubiquinone/menaquinone biosynthesis C-methylase UbiE
VSEFTGERVIPGKVNDDLWAEHISRYIFARRFTAEKRVLDLGCGTGYGTAALAERARLTVGIDVSIDAVGYASVHFPSASFVECSATALPFDKNSFDLVTAFEVIEHLSDWSAMLAEARRVLCPDGLLMVSTPNKLYYAEARGASGPNPYHQHEFEFAEFRAALAERFSHVTIFLQDRLESFAFYAASAESEADGYLERSTADPTQANFFLAVCSNAPIPNGPAFLYVPKASNLLSEREKHIHLLEGELVQVNRWLQETMAERDELIGKYQDIERHLEERSTWALRAEASWKTAQQRIVQLQDDFKAEQNRAVAAIASLTEENLGKTRWAEQLTTNLSTAQERIVQLQEEYESEQANAAAAIARLTEDNLRKTEWALDTIRRLEETETSLAGRVERVQHLEMELAKHVERAAAEKAQLRVILDQIEIMRRSRWIRLGRLFGVGPDLSHLRSEDP